jgi:hypothetical protein
MTCPADSRRPCSRMALVVTHPVDLVCPPVQAHRRGRRNRDVGTVDRYTVLPISGGFSLVHSSPTPETAVIACKCGFEFYA